MVDVCRGGGGGECGGGDRGCDVCRGGDSGCDECRGGGESGGGDDDVCRGGGASGGCECGYSSSECSGGFVSVV